MATSSNGYPVLDQDTSGPWPHLREWRIPGVQRRLLLRDGAAGFLLVHMALWFHEEIESIDRGFDDWGWSPRKIGGTNVWSNHASGTAMDLNADQHPQRTPVLQTFTAAEVRAIHRRLPLYRDCIKWGGDYRTTVDSMHYELIKPINDVITRAQVLQTSPRGKLILKANPGVQAIIS